MHCGLRIFFAWLWGKEVVLVRVDEVVGSGRASRWVGWSASTARLPTPCQEPASTGAPGRFGQLSICTRFFENPSFPSSTSGKMHQSSARWSISMHFNACSLCLPDCDAAECDAEGVESQRYALVPGISRNCLQAAGGSRRRKGNRTQRLLKGWGFCVQNRSFQESSRKRWFRKSVLECAWHVWSLLF